MPSADDLGSEKEPDRRGPLTADAVLARLVCGIEADGIRAHGVHVRVRGEEASHRWAPEVPADIHSVAKGVCVLAAGIAADEGLLDVDAPVAGCFPEVRLGAGVDAVTMRRLLTMTSGVDLPWTPTLFDDWPDLAREFLGRPSRGEVFQYANASTYTAMRALAAVVGDVRDWLVPRLFAPLGIDEPEWDRCPNGYVKAGEGLRLTTTELARIGRLIQDRGVWQGERLVSAGWIDGMHTRWRETGGSPGYDRYALAGWAGPGEHVWRLHGAYGQLLVFADDAVVTVTADDNERSHRLAELTSAALAGG